VVTLNDDVQLIAHEIVRSGALNMVHLGLDFFDASINRTGALVTGSRAVQKAFLFALLEPTDHLIQLEQEGRLFERLAMLEEMKSMPFGAVWDYYCLMMGTPPGHRYIQEIQNYEKEELAGR
jgi:L-rhamnose isomerase